MDNSAPPSDYVVEINNLSRKFRTKVALDDVTLSVPRGCVFGLLGESGAGKTTLMKHLLGLLKPQSGKVRVAGYDPVKDPESALSSLGYLSEDRDIPKWMRIDELMRYTQGLYPNWDESYAEKLRESFDLDASQKIRTLSRGQLAKTGLIVALAHRPQLLLLDEPSSGLDAVVRRHILSAVMRTAASEGRTVIFSSHLLHEVERVADRVAIIHKGKLLLSDTMESIKSSHHRLEVIFNESQDQVPQFPGALSCEGAGKEWSVVCNGQLEELKAEIARHNARVVKESDASLEDIFVARVGATALAHVIE